MAKEVRARGVRCGRREGDEGTHGTSAMGAISITMRPSAPFSWKSGIDSGNVNTISTRIVGLGPNLTAGRSRAIRGALDMAVPGCEIAGRGTRGARTAWSRGGAIRLANAR